jgi:hypothetical protein
MTDKMTDKIVIGAFTISVTLETHGETGLLFTGKCMEHYPSHTGQRKSNPSGHHNHTDDQYAKDVTHSRQKLAEEIAKKCHAHEQRKRFLNQSQSKITS